MHKHLVRSLNALALAAIVCTTAQAGTMVLPAVQLTLSGWAYGSGNSVLATGYSGAAGGFGGTLTGAGAYSSPSFITYCIELEEHFSFSAEPMLGYAVVNGASYFQSRRNDAGIADRLGRLLTYVADHPGVVGSAAASTALQLAIWNMVYDSDYSVSSAGRFRDISGYSSDANSLLSGAQGVTTSRYDVYALERSGSQDFLLASPRPGSNANGVPEPGSLTLAAAALAGLMVFGRRRASAG